MRLVFDTFGKSSDVLRWEPCPLPEPGPGETLVRLLAAPINPADLNTIEGTYGEALPLPAVPGIEGCGVVEHCPSGMFSTGDRVIFLKRAATWATHTVVPTSALFPVPTTLDPLQAAMLKVNPATAWQLLHGFEALSAGDWIVQNLGNSAVGRCVIQLCRDLGIRSVSFVRNAAQREGLIALGADGVFPDDEAGAAAALEVMGGARAALAFNAVGGDSALRLMKLLRVGGSHITYGAMGRKPVTLPNGLLLFQDIRLRGLWVSRWVNNAPRDEVDRIYRDLAQRVLAGRLLQPVDGHFPLDHWRDALARLHAPDRAGKVLFSMPSS